MAEENKTIEAFKAFAEDAAPHICKRCGFDQRQEYNPVNEETLQRYFKAALAQVPFSQVYKLFGGVLELTFEEASGKLLSLQEKALMTRNADGKSAFTDAMDFALLPSLAEAVWVPEKKVRKVLYHADTGRRLELMEKGEIPEELANMPIIQLQAIRNAFAEFSKLCGSLIVAAQDENFWKGAGRN